MPTSTPEKFLVYRSSAGSGKTTALVQTYMRLALSNDDPRYYRRILAITFTNKAANEIKDRILKTCYACSALEEKQWSGTSKVLFDNLCDDLQTTPEELQKKLRSMHAHMLHHYGELAISTIDSFVHRVVKSFAYDLDLPMDFEVATEFDELLEVAIDRLIERVEAGEDELTRLLLAFSESKIADDKSWHVEKDLKELASALLQDSENRAYLKKLEHLELKDFSKLRKSLHATRLGLEKEIRQAATSAKQLITQQGPDTKYFHQGNRGICKFFERLAEPGSPALKHLTPNTYVQETITEGKWTSSKAGQTEKTAIDAIRDKLETYYHTITDQAPDLCLLKLVLEPFYALALLHELERLLTTYKQEQNLIHISDFYDLITPIVQEQEAPYIYERIGEKYNHYLIDEFQDTSVIQFQNLLPLLEDALSQGQTCMLVGDAKQAIYRWRGGEVEQFVNLPELNGDNSRQRQTAQLFAQNFKAVPLQSNYRSRKAVVHFNNRFFEWVQGHADFAHRNFYTNPEQKSAAQASDDGLVELTFREAGEEETYTELLLDDILKYVRKATSEHGYNYRDIAVLCSKNKLGSKVAYHLLSNNVAVVSSESLLLYKAPEVRLLLAWLRWLYQPGEALPAAELYTWYHHVVLQQKDIRKDDFFLKLRESQQSPTELVTAALGEHGNAAAAALNQRFTAYEAVIHAITLFELHQRPSPFIQFFLDEVLGFRGKESSDIHTFLEFWEAQGYKKSIVLPETMDAVRVMTIHKAKGLEFPVVLLPIAGEQGWNPSANRNYLWESLKKPFFNKLPAQLYPFKSDLELTDDLAPYYKAEKDKATLDYINMLYVGMTRAADRLWIGAEKPKEKQLKTPFKHARYLLAAYLQTNGQWQPDQNPAHYTFGEETTSKKAAQDAREAPLLENPQTAPGIRNKRVQVRRNHRLLWSEDKVEKINYGNLVHALLARIRTADDLTQALAHHRMQGELDEKAAREVQQRMEQLLQHPEIKPWYAPGLRVINERPLIAGGKLLQPDRVVTNPETHETAVLDYKTGAPQSRHKQQVQKYAHALQQVGLKKVKGYLVYLQQTPPEIVAV